MSEFGEVVLLKGEDKMSEMWIFAKALSRVHHERLDTDVCSSELPLTHVYRGQFFLACFCSLSLSSDFP